MSNSYSGKESDHSDTKNLILFLSKVDLLPGKLTSPGILTGPSQEIAHEIDSWQCLVPHKLGIPTNQWPSEELK